MNRHTITGVCQETGINTPVLKCAWMFKDIKGQGFVSHLKGNTSNIE